jgi:hypothetical protein
MDYVGSHLGYPVELHVGLLVGLNAGVETAMNQATTRRNPTGYPASDQT